jgi:hypothetical protein
MKQYRVTAADFAQPSEPDAVMHAADLADIRRLAGLTEDLGYAGLAGTVGGNMDNVPNETEVGIGSPIGSMSTPIGTRRRDLLNQLQAEPASELWFIINFTEPDQLDHRVQLYLKTHPEEYREE